MTDLDAFRGFSVLVRVHHTRWPSSGYYDAVHLMSDITYRLSYLGRPLSPEQVTQWTKQLDEWSGHPSIPWTHAHDDVTVIVRLTERFTGWGPNVRPL